MCKLKSAIILKNRIFMPDYDSHSKMLEELKITDNYFNASKLFVRAELAPENEDVFSDIDGWKFCVDQDITPEWFDEKNCAERMRKAVKEWANTHIFIGQNGLKISHGENIFIKDCEDVDICGNATVKYTRGNATVKYIRGNATVENICDEATVKYIYSNATVKCICGNATVKKICSKATVNYICGNATVISSRYATWNNSASLIICDNATFKDCSSKTIYQAGGWKFADVKNKAWRQPHLLNN